MIRFLMQNDFIGLITRRLLIPALAGSVGCIPIQQTRDTQIETYHQRYDLCGYDEAFSVIAAIFGSQNQSALATYRRDTWKDYVEKAANHQFIIAGQIVFSLSVNPADSSQFFVEGHGKHIVYDMCTSELMASSKFHIVDDGPHWISNLNEGQLTMWLKQTTVREFEQDVPRFAHTADIFAKIYVRKIAEGIFSIDYEKEHEIGVSMPWRSETYGDRISVRPIGYVQFDGRRDGRSLIDLRDIDSPMIKGYDKMLRGGGLSPARDHASFVRWLPKLSCKIPEKDPCK